MGPPLGESRRPEGHAQGSFCPRCLVKVLRSNHSWPRQLNLGLISWHWTHIYRGQLGLELGLEHLFLFGNDKMGPRDNWAERFRLLP